MVKKIAVTGGLSSGKSTFCEMLRKLGEEQKHLVIVVSADQIVHQLILQDKSLQKQLTALLGDEILVDGQIDRKKVADQVFQSSEKLNALENLLHPLVRASIRSSYEEVAAKGEAALFVAEVPLLFETEDPSAFYDATVTISSPESEQLARSKFSAADFYRRNSRQLSNQQKERRATFVIDNSGSLDSLKQQAQNLLQQLS